MPLARSQFEWLFLHAQVLSYLSLSLMAQDILEAPRNGVSAALASPEAHGEDALRVAPGDVIDWFGANDLSDEQLRELRESAERELAAFDGAKGPHPGDGVPLQAVEQPPLDLEHELELAYVQRDTVAADAQAAFGRIDPARLDALLEAVDGGSVTLIDRMHKTELADWLQRMHGNDVALNDLLDYVLS